MLNIKSMLMKLIIIYLIFFSIGFVKEWITINKLYESNLNKLYSEEGDNLNIDDVDYSYKYFQKNKYDTALLIRESLKYGLSFGVLTTFFPIYISIMYKWFDFKTIKEMLKLLFYFSICITIMFFLLFIILI